MVKRENTIGNIIFWLGLFILILGFMVGLGLGSAYSEFGEIAWMITLTWWGSAFISGMLFIGFSEVIELLHKIKYGETSPQNEKKYEVKHVIKEEEIATTIGEYTTQRLVDLYKMQEKSIEEVIVTPFQKKLIVKCVNNKNETQYEVVSTAGNDAINSSIDKHPKIKEWLSENKGL
ncbi:hypothetical protein [Bacillus alkalicellulosilyticus]|uniref:hypothetical protein n=1 Tax=Alkalihalobacterium alkalicellulosilyticum TaxID=1912214 RepID=UPI000997BCB3|nr:hypothetical protein [Bacillus alkalicellulosilyticus]